MFSPAKSSIGFEPPLRRRHREVRLPDCATKGRRRGAQDRGNLATPSTGCAEARQRARQAAKEELYSIVEAWNDAFALEAFFTELSVRAATLDGDERANLEARIQTARELAGGQDAVDRFLKWKLPPESEEEDEDVVADQAGDHLDDEDD